MAYLDSDADSADAEAGPWPAFADLLSATTLLFLILFAAIAVPAIARARSATDQLKERESTLREIEEALRDTANDQVHVRRVGDYLLVSITGEATFPKDRFELSELKPDGRAILREFGSRIRSRPGMIQQIDQVQVVGHTSHEGGEEHNWRLSAARAATVALFLIDSVRIDPCTVTALGRSRYYPLDPSRARRGAVNSLDRRIELEIRPIVKSDSLQRRRREGCVPREEGA